MAIERIQLNLIPTGKMPVCHTKQYDKGREIGIDLLYGLKPYFLTDEALELDVRKSDNHLVTIDVPYTEGTSSVVFATTEQMCAVSGSNICALKVTKGGVVIGSLNFVMEVEKSVLEGGLPSESDIENLATQMTAIAEPMVEEIAPPIVEELVPQVIGEDYYTKTQTDEAIATAIEGKADTTYVDTELAKKADKTDTYTKSQVDTALSGKADKNTTYTKTQVDDKLSEKANADDVYQKTETYSKTETDELVSPKADKTYVDTQLQAKANASDVYTKSQTDNLLNDKANVTDLPDMSQYYDKGEVDDLLDDKADKSDTYTKEQVDDIVYNILPDDTASGSVANFETDLALPLKSLKVDVNAVQDLHGQSAPYPSGGQLWDEEWEVGSLDNTTGLPTPDPDNIRAKNYCYCSPNTSYYFYIGVSKNIRYYWYDANKQLIDNNTVRNNTITSPNNARYFKIRTTQTYGNTYLNNISVNYPSTDTDYHPYSNICPIGGWDSVKVIKAGKNLVDVLKLEHLDTNGEGLMRYGIKLSKPATYSIKSFNTSQESYVYARTIVNGVYGSVYYIQAGSSNTPRTITLSKGVLILYDAYVDSSTHATSILNNVQVEIGSTFTDFEPFNGNTEVINLGGTYYGGHFTQDKDGHRRFIPTYNMLRITTVNGIVDAKSARSSVSPFSSGYTLTTNPFLCNMLTPSNYSSANDNHIHFFNTQGVTMMFADDIGTTKAEWETYLNNNPLWLCYKLNVPLEPIDLPDGEPITTFIGTNNIYADTGDSAVVFKESVNEYVEKKIASVQALALNT